MDQKEKKRIVEIIDVEMSMTFTRSDFIVMSVDDTRPVYGKSRYQSPVYEVSPSLPQKGSQEDIEGWDKIEKLIDD